MERSKKQSDLNEYARKVIRHKARQLVGKYGFTWDDFDDLAQEMALDLLTRLPKFDCDRASLNTFIARVVDRRVSTLIRHRKQAKRDFRREACSLDDPMDNQDEAGTRRRDGVSQDEYDLRTGKQVRPNSERIDLLLDLSFALADLPPELQDLAGRLRDRSISEIARDLHVPRATLYGIGIARLRKAFEDKGLGQYL